MFILAGQEPLRLALPNSPYSASGIHPERTRSAHEWQMPAAFLTPTDLVRKNPDGDENPSAEKSSNGDVGRVQHK